jgi:hypothetical protein
MSAGCQKNLGLISHTITCVSGILAPWHHNACPSSSIELYLSYPVAPFIQACAFVAFVTAF